MTVEEFVENCAKCGYASKPIAQAYAMSHKELTEDDFIEVYRITERRLSARYHSINGDCRYQMLGGGRTSKSYYQNRDENQ